MMTIKKSGVTPQTMASFDLVRAKNRMAAVSVYGFKPAKPSDGLFLTPKQLAKHLGISTKTLDRMRQRGEGPPYVRIGKHRIAYPLAEIDAWVHAQMVGESLIGSDPSTIKQ